MQRDLSQLFDMMAVLGLVAVVGGAWSIHSGLAAMLGGLAAIAAGLWLSRAEAMKRRQQRETSQE